jgi:hypothetical protein
MALSMPHLMTVDDTFEGDDLLPGFALPIVRLFAFPRAAT